MTTPEAMRKALEALNTALAGLRWYQDMVPQYTDGSDDEANAEIESAIAALESALAAPVQEPTGWTILDVGFIYKDGIHTPTVLVGFAPNDWTARDAFAAHLRSVPQGAAGVRPCAGAQDMGGNWCGDRSQCWEPCGELGKSAEHAIPVGVKGRAPWDAQPGCHACGRAVGGPCSEPEGCRNPPMPSDESGRAGGWQ